MKYSEIKKLKQKLRNNFTPSEQTLWRYIRRRQVIGRKFLRQHAIIYDSNESEHFFFIPDFYCHEEKLAIELDGKIHEFTKAKDAKKDEILKSKGIRVLRIKNEELKNIEHVLDKIKSCFNNED
ncbi:hypothetical protein DF185_15520 [Marinifilum breve]|uniref:DUF559 domain-containing protein n=1 Tax=Marinifilum breve TaxID=2184082 RepID=A0A2V3ZX87_9BACT|nr:DUF559 domain-containing protein [Marinifilum breve]PXX98785.1 hypothetical protein DF185_15520 [Marinifilum breve]